MGHADQRLYKPQAVAYIISDADELLTRLLKEGNAPRPLVRRSIT